MKKLFETGMILFAAMGFWGMIYPDLCFVEDVCTAYIVESDGYHEDVTVDMANSEMLQADMFTCLCMAHPEQIQLKSKFMEVFITESKGSSNVVNQR